SPDGRFLAAHVLSEPLVKVWRIGQPQPILTAPVHLRAYDFSPDARQFAAVERQGEITVFDLNAGRPARRSSARQGQKPWCVAFDPEAGRLAVGGNGRVLVVGLADGKEAANLLAPRGAFDVAWHPGGKHLASADSDGRVQVWDLTVNRDVALLDTH